MSDAFKDDVGVAEKDHHTFGAVRMAAHVSQRLIDLLMPWLPAFKAAVKEVRSMHP
jgi:hypothetical protein